MIMATVEVKPAITEKTVQCPVCGHIETERAADATGYACPQCGFKAAFASMFAGRGSLEAWKKAAADAHVELASRMRQELSLLDRRRSSFEFALSGDSLALGPLKTEEDAAPGRWCILRNGRMQAEDPHVTQVSMPENGGYRARLMSDGTVGADGVNDYGQCDVAGMNGIKRILAMPKCLYAVTQDGAVVFSGQSFFRGIEAWHNVVSLTCGAHFMIGLCDDGHVEVSSDAPLLPEISEGLRRWRDVVSVTAADNGDAAICLKSDGSVGFAGHSNDDRSQAQEWKDMSAVAIESRYAVGLRKDGHVLLAGGSKNALLDLGRMDAAEWKDIVSISCSRSGIAGIAADGTILLAGNLRDIAAQRAGCESISDSVRRTLLAMVSRKG